MSESLIDFFNDNFGLYLRFQGKPKEIKLVEKNNFLKITSDIEYEKSHPFFDSLGNLVTNPPYQLIQLQNKYLCFIEMPVIQEKSLKMVLEKKNEENFLVLSGIKKDTNVSTNIIKSDCFRITGYFNFKIPLIFGSIKLKIDKKSTNYNDGILIVIINIIIEEEEKIIY